MAKGKVFEVENRLAAAMRRPGGKAIADLLRNAERRVSAIRDDCLFSLARQIERMRGVSARLDRDPDALDELYAAANEVFAIAALFVVVWGIAIAYWKLGNLDNRWAPASTAPAPRPERTGKQ